jgi:hypothetical protein
LAKLTNQSVNKLLEEVKYRLYKHLQLNDVSFKFQFGFRAKHSTSLALIEVNHNIYGLLDISSSVSGVFLKLHEGF